MVIACIVIRTSVVTLVLQELPLLLWQRRYISQIFITPCGWLYLAVGAIVL